MAWKLPEGGMIEESLKDGEREVQASAKGRGRNDPAHGWADYGLWATSGPPPVSVQVMS